MLKYNIEKSIDTCYLIDDEYLEKYNGEFYYLPFNKNYVINIYGDLYDLNRNCKIDINYRLDNYPTYRLKLKDTNGTVIYPYVHRVLASVFLNHGTVLKRNEVVNHIDENKFNYNINNLEIITDSENKHHAGILRLSDKCLPISIRFIDSGEVVKFSSYKDAAEYLNISKDAIAYRAGLKDFRIWDNKYQLYPTINNIEWPNDDNIFGVVRPVLCWNLLTNKINKFESQTKAAEFLNLSPAKISLELNEEYQRIL